MRAKRHWERAVKKSVSMPEILLDKASDRQRQLTLPTFSDYIQLLIRLDLQQGEARRPSEQLSLSL